jgi:hypothetical protein
MKSDAEVLNALVADGIIGAALAALITNSKSSRSLGAMARAVLFATLEAHENAKKTNIPLVIVAQNVLYEISADGTRRMLKKIPRTDQRVPKRFRLR